MKNLSFPFKSITLSMLLLVAFTACQKEEQSNQVDSQPQVPIAKTYEAKVMQQTSNVIVNMLAENPELFNNINEIIKSDAVEYMKDRILFVDLFRNPQFAKAVNEQENHTTFSSEFKKHATANIQCAQTETRATILDADVLMQYLIENNISIYCPFPLEDYEANNRIPAIAANIGEEYEELPGVQFYADGSYDSVMVSQAYADLHPVWLINQEDDYIFNEMYNRNKTINVNPIRYEVTPPILEDYNPKPNSNTKHYEVKISSVYLTEYWGPLSEGDIDLHLCFCSSNPTYSTVEECFLGTFDRIITVQIPRSYVKHAKLGYDKGWFALDCAIENDWTTDELQKYFAAYDYDPKYGIEHEETYNTNYKISAGEAKIVGGEAGESHGAKITITYKSKDDLIALDKWDRCYIFDKVLKLGDATWTTEDGGTYKTALDGNYMTKPASSLTLAIYCEEY
jgi:hypothetical protein